MYGKVLKVQERTWYYGKAQDSVERFSKVQESTGKCRRIYGKCREVRGNAGDNKPKSIQPAFSPADKNSHQSYSKPAAVG